jgi:hypothetical protein
MIKVLRGVRTVAPHGTASVSTGTRPGRLPVKALISQNVKLAALALDRVSEAAQEPRARAPSRAPSR